MAVISRIFNEALQKYIYSQNQIIIMSTPPKTLTPEQREEIRKEHFDDLEKIERVVLEATCLTDVDKQGIMTELQNAVENNIEAKVYIMETQLNNK